MATLTKDKLKEIREQKRKADEAWKLAKRISGVDLAADDHRQRDRLAKQQRAAVDNEIAARVDQVERPDFELLEWLKWNLTEALLAMFPAAFPLPFSRDHLRVIEIMQRVMIEGGQFAVAMPRGFGKTTIAVRSALWALLFGHRKSVLLVAASDPLGLRMLRGIKDELRYNEHLLKLFPDVCIPIRLLEGKSAKTIAQTYHGVPTAITWKADEVVFPTIGRCSSSGSRVGVAGITGGKIRGQHHVQMSGKIVRPDVAIADDPQDRESAKSPTQTADRMDVINADILGMAGPTERMSCVVPCTVIQEGDLADQLLDRQKNPQWQGVRTKMLDAMPTNETHWETYRDLRARGLRDERPATVWNQYLRDNWDAMHEGAAACWPQRFKPDEISPVQSAMNWYFDSPSAFAAEAQNEPLKARSDSIEPITSQETADKANGLQRGIVPLGCTHMACFVDVQGKLLYWAVAAFSDDFTGHVVDYGTMPDQKRLIFSLSDAKRTLASAFPVATQEGQIYDGLTSLADSVLSREFEREDGAKLQVERFMVDSGWQTDTIYKWAREYSRKQSVNVVKGRGITAKSVPMSDYKPRVGEKIGHYWLQRTVGKGILTRVIEPDTNYWKSQAYRRLRLSKGDRGTITLFGKPTDHPTFSAHCSAEYPIEKEEVGRRVWEWHHRVDKPDNHWWDCLVGCLVGAAILGCQMTLGQSRVVPANPNVRKTFAELAKGRS